jgi:hypothetical protein
VAPESTRRTKIREAELVAQSLHMCEEVESGWSGGEDGSGTSQASAIFAEGE